MMNFGFSGVAEVAITFEFKGYSIVLTIVATVFVILRMRKGIMDAVKVHN